MKHVEDFVITALIVGALAFLCFVGYTVWDGVSAEQEHQGYCEALSARYYSGSGPNGLCIKDNTVIKEWK